MNRDFGKYRLENLVARGGMAEIFSAFRKTGDTGERICIKRIRPEFSDDSEFESMFRQEAQIASSISHPNVVRVFDFDRWDGRLFIAMEFVDGMDLKKVMRIVAGMGFQVPVGFSFHVARCLLEALDAASSVSVEGVRVPVVHRDISPHNILVSKAGGVLLTDFGIAKARGSSAVTRTGVIKGKLAYLSPEQAGGKAVGPASDLYGAGLVIYELLSGNRFNPGSGEHELLACVMNPQFKRLDWLSTQINDFLERLLEKDVARRFGSARHALDALALLDIPLAQKGDAGKFINGLIANSDRADIEELSTPHSDRIDESPGGSGLTDLPTRKSKDDLPVAARSGGRKNAVAVFLAAAVLAVIGGVVFMSYFSGREGDETLASDSPASMVLPPSDEPLVVKIEKPLKEIPKAHTVPKKETKNFPIEKKDQEAAIQFGRLQINCRPWAKVRIDGVDIGTTPISGHRIRTGKHRVLLANEELDFSKAYNVFVRPSKVVRIDENIEETLEGSNENN